MSTSATIYIAILFIILPLTNGSFKSDSSESTIFTIDLEVPKNHQPPNFATDSLRNPKILHGFPASNGQFPFAAFLHIRRGSITTFCTGSLISNDWIITARTCFVNNPNQPADSLQAFLGSNDHQSSSMTSSFVNRGAWYNNANGINPNIALFRLDVNMPTTNLIRPIRLPRLINENFGFDDFNITTIGWGRLHDNTFPRILQFGQFRILAVHLCFWNLNFVTFDFCSQHQNLVSMIADRDIGGPSIITENDGQMTLIGITSTTMNLPNGLSANSVRVSSFLRFINENTGIPFR